MIKIENRIPFAELGEAIGTGREEYREHMEREFYVQDPVHEDHEKIITRSDFEDTMASMQCWFLSDDAMERIAKQVSAALKSYPAENVTDEDDLQDAMCKEEEDALRAFGVCYYEDEIPDISRKGARLFSVDHGYGRFNGMVESDGEEMVEMTTDDGKVVTTWLGLVVEEY
jgi:hypothetical protein